uniref:TIL domain-containing protein n=1 Tax=Steinernema glaseri TaxID=37863 RepID=A0A1I7ZSN0_9BILA
MFCLSLNMKVVVLCALFTLVFGGQLQCGRNEVVSQCLNTCDQYCGRQRRACTMQCDTGHACQCKDGYCRDESGSCVRPA